MSIVIPVYNEYDVLPEFRRRLAASTAALPYDIEIVYVNDGSTDATLETLESLYNRDNIGLVTAAGAFGYGAFIVVRTLVYGNPVPGYPSLIVIILFLGGMQLMAIGILGEYIGRIFNETKNRPLYFVNNYKPRRATNAADQARSISSAAGKL